MFVRPYKVTDFSAVSEIDFASHSVHTPDSIMQDKIHKGNCWIADVDGVVAGFLIAIIKDGLPYVYNISIRDGYRGQGFATDLLTVFHNHYAAFEQTWLQVNTCNPAQRLYFQLGYRTKYVDKNFYGPSKDALCMYRPYRS